MWQLCDRLRLGNDLAINAGLRNNYNRKPFKLPKPGGYLVLVLNIRNRYQLLSRSESRVAQL